MKKEHVNINCFKFDEDKYQAKLDAAILSYQNNPTSYERVALPLSLAFYHIEKLVIEGKKLSQKFKPIQTQDGLVMYFEGEEYEKGLQELPEKVKAGYELELEQIKKKQQDILENQIYQQSIKAEGTKKEKADQKLKDDAKQRAEEYFIKLED